MDFSDVLKILDFEGKFDDYRIGSLELLRGPYCNRPISEDSADRLRSDAYYVGGNIAR